MLKEVQSWPLGCLFWEMETICEDENELTLFVIDDIGEK